MSALIPSKTKKRSISWAKTNTAASQGNSLIFSNSDLRFQIWPFLRAGPGGFSRVGRVAQPQNAFESLEMCDGEGVDLTIKFPGLGLFLFRLQAVPKSLEIRHVQNNAVSL